MRVELDNTPNQHTQTPQEIARKIKDKFNQTKQIYDKRNLQSFLNRTKNEQGTSTNIHSYQNNRPLNQNQSPAETYVSPPLPSYPPPVRPPPPDDYLTEHIKDTTKRSTTIVF